VVHTLPAYWVTLSIAAPISAMVALSVGVITGRTGQITLCQYSFAAVGAWSIGWMNVHHVPGGFYVWLILAGLCAVPLGLLVALPALRLRGALLAAVTLAFATAVDGLLSEYAFPGSNNLQLLARPSAFTSDAGFFVLCWIVFVVIAAAVWFLQRSSVGLAWRAVANSERGTAALGRSVASAKFTAFAVGAFVAAIAGALLADQVGTADPQSFATEQSLAIFAVAVMFGAGNIDGAALSGVAGVLVPELLRRIGLPDDLANVLFALGVVQVLASGRSVSDGWHIAAHRRGRRARAAAVATAPPPSEQVAPRGARPTASGAPVLTVHGLRVQFGSVVALDGVELEVAPLSVHGLIGPNGAGKSTMVDSISGFVPHGGTINVAGRDLAKMSVVGRARAGVRRTFQQDRTPAELTVAQYLRLAAGRRISMHEMAETAAFIGAPAPDELIGDTDAGSRRLLEIAAALCAAPRLLLLDEPAAGLSEQDSLRLADRIKQIPERFGCSILLIEHDMTVVSACCTQITVLDFGKVIAHGPTEDVLADERVIEAYLGQELSVA
jgi:branched-chain amino acid transport system permease protein